MLGQNRNVLLPSKMEMSAFRFFLQESAKEVIFNRLFQSLRYFFSKVFFKPILFDKALALRISSSRSWEKLKY